MVAALASRHQIRCVTTILLVLCEQPLPQTLHLTDCKSERQVKKSSCPKRLFVTKFLFFFLTMDLYAYCHHGHARWYKSAQLRRWQCLQHSHMQPCWMLLCIFFHWHTNRLLFLEKKKKTQKKQMATYVFKWHNRSHLGPTEVMKDSESFTHRKW